MGSSVQGVAESDTTERLPQAPHVPDSELSPLCLLLDASHSEALASGSTIPVSMAGKLA